MGAPDWMSTTNGAGGAKSSVKDYVQSGHEPLAPTRKKKKKKFPSHEEEDSNEQTNGDTIDALFCGPDADPSALRVSEHTNGYGDDDEEEDKASTADGHTNGGPVDLRRLRGQVSASRFNNVDDSMPISIKQLINNTSPIPREPEDPNHIAIATWFSEQTGHQYQVSPRHREKIIEHLLNHKYPGTTPDWLAATRQVFWRAVIRASYFWVNPDTKTEAGKPTPIHRPDGLYENDFKTFVLCCAERADRVGRDLPSPEYVKWVEDQVRDFLGKAEKIFKKELEHLAFLLMWDEEHKRILKEGEMVERVMRVFGRLKFNWRGCQMFAPREVQRARGGHRKVEVGVDYAEKVWEDAMAAL
ncbi:uncharacterized protein LTR77_003861 [Saxophila tyrrhenica]|uniref:Uncharacterized protein n=1 Tax=Saxophila tyrrhenica TaxID=1690608 RepID=A0AAV9PEU2_9PEZI|nr:hypothetical protein LTR77_003861 [Saxophila tyrrhenica]